jgi:6,7-dimethyl-8-ribityllumazine synthase
MTPVGKVAFTLPGIFAELFPVDTYTAQATVGDIVKGTTNHKVG